MEKEEEQIDLWDYLRVIIKHRWTIVTVFTVIFLSVTIFSFTTTPIYRGTARLLIEKENPNVVTVEEVMRVDSSGTDYYQTQYQIIESRAVARKVISGLQLDKNEEFVAQKNDKFSLLRSIKDAIGYVASLLKTEKNKEKISDSPLVSQFIARIKVSPVRNSRLVDIGFEAEDPVLAARIANAVARAYIDLDMETKLKATRDAVAWLNTRMEEERKKVDAAEQLLLRYKEQYGIITDFSSDVESITAQKLAELNKQVVEAEAKRVEAETRYRQAAAMEANPDMLDSVPEVLNNELIQQIKAMEVEVYKRMSEFSKRYGQNHPQMIALQNELNTIKTRKITEVKRVINSLYNEYKVAQARENSLKSSLGRQKGESLVLNQKAVDYSVLKREAESARDMYDLLLKRFKETSLTEEIKTGNIRIIDLAEISKTPVKPKKMLNIILAACMGSFLGIGLAFFLEYLDDTIKVPEEIKRYLNIPYLGLVPAFADNSGSSTDKKPEGGDLISVSAPRSAASESYRSIRTNITFSSVDSPPQVILVSSMTPEEGKTTTAANLAVVMAQGGSNVLLLDCDLRKPKMRKLFHIKDNDKGLSTVLAGSCGINEAIIHTETSNIDIVPSGPIPPNPSDILGSQRMAQLIEQLRTQYERIIIDTPPVMAATDAVVLSKIVDGVILVIRAGETRRKIIENGLSQFQRIKAPIFGAVLNGVEMERDRYYYYHHYYYYYYGEEGESKKKTHHKRKASNHSSDVAKTSDS
ncbi:MAG: polysaccharide biosynthesis tyrosine autokinase [Syntrophales bacterium]